MSRTYRSLVLALAVCAATVTHSWAIPIPALELTVGITPITFVPVGTSLGGNLFNYTGTQSTANWTLEWDVTVDPDPFISAVMSLTNNTGSTQTFTLNVSLPIAPPLVAPTKMGGSIQVGVTDANFNGTATIANAVGIPGYDAQIDGSSALTMLNPFSLSAPFAGGSNSTSTSSGLPGPTIVGPAVNTSIGINHKFTLTAGDKATFSSFFVVVPEPSSVVLALLGGGLCAVGYWRRKR